VVAVEAEVRRAFGERLRRLREEQGLTQEALADGSVSPTHISLIERGKRSPSAEVLQQLAHRLGTSTTRLLDGRPSQLEDHIALEQAYARLAVEHGEANEARARLERLLAGDPDGLPQRTQDDINWWLAVACDRAGDTVAAIRLFGSLFERAVQHDTHIPVSLAGMAVVGCYVDAGDLHQAVTIGERALAAAREDHLVGTVDYFRLAATVMSAYMGLGDNLHALAWADRYLTEASDHDQPAGAAAIYWNAAIVSESDGRPAAALALCERALAVYGEGDTGRDNPRLQTDMAWLLLGVQPPQVERALALLESGRENLNDLGSRADRGYWNAVRSTALLYLGDTSGAEDAARQALKLVDGVPLERARALMALNDALAAQGIDTAAEEALTLVFDELSAVPSTRSTALVWRELADRLGFFGHVEEALAAGKEALDAAGVRSRASHLLPQIEALRSRPPVPATTS